LCNYAKEVLGKLYHNLSAAQKVQKYSSEDSSWLKEKGIRYVVIHRNAMNEEEWKKWQRYADIEPVHKNDLYVYDLGSEG
jgi:hypothetical protein